MLLFSLCTLAFAALAAANNNYCQQYPYNLILAFKGYPPAMDYCSKAYPVPRSTHTYWQHHTKIAGSTCTSTRTMTEQTTATVCVTIAAKRDATPEPQLIPMHRRDAAKGWASCSSKMKSGGYMGSACSCIESCSTTTTTIPTTTTCTQTTSCQTTTITTTATTTTTFTIKTGRQEGTAPPVVCPTAV